MPGIGGLSIANNLLSNAVQLNLNRNQRVLQGSVDRLSSGLRINSAADDPSGLAVSETLQAQVNGFDQASQNVQTATNAATVADGALQTTTDILQRIRSLAVEAASDITSPSDKQDLQAEVDQLLLEVNRISQNTQFNGLALLDGSHAGFVPEQSAFLTVQSNAALASAGANPTVSGIGGFTNGDFSSPVLSNNSYSLSPPDGWTQSGPVGDLLTYRGTDPYGDASAPGFQAVGINSGATLSQTLTGLDPNATYTITFDAAKSTGGPATTGQVSVNGQTVASLSSTQLSYSFQTFTTASFTANAAGEATVTFSDPGPAANFDFANVTLNGTVANANSGLLIASAVGVGANFGTTVATAANGLATGGDGIQGFTSATLTAGYTVDGTIEIQVINTGASIAAQETFFASGLPATANVSPVSVAGQLLAANEASTLFDNVQIVTGNFTTADVGTTAYIKVSQDVPALSNPSNPAFTFQSGAVEGATIQVGIQATNTQSLRISNINLLLSASSDPTIGAEDAIGQLDLALQNLLTQRANLGAIVVRLNEDEDNDNVASVNLQASESGIRDLDVAAETTNFNKTQILVQVGTSVLAQANTNAQSVLKLFP